MRNLLTLAFRFFALFVFLSSALGAEAAALVVKDDYRSPRNRERPLRKATTLIVLHTTEAHAKSSLNKLSERGEAHYCVTEKGIVYRIVDRDREAFHAGRSMWNGKEDCDEYAIGIEVVGYHDQSMPVVQLDALRELLDRLKKTYRLKDHQVVCHSHVAYGAPNAWHKKKHRGRKRCGMLFAMASVRRKLGLATRPAYDPDVKAKRLVQADGYLNSVLYGSVDTMARFYGDKAAAVSAKPQAAKVAKPPAKTPAPPSGTPAPAAAKPAPAARAPQAKPAPQLPGAPAPAAVKPAPAPQAPQTKPAPQAPGKAGETPEADSDWLQTLGLKGGYFRKKAKFVNSPAPANPKSPPDANVLPLPSNLVIGKVGDDIRDLEALVKLPGYARGGPVSPEKSPYRIAGPAWNAATTYYYTPRGRILRGDKIDEKAIEPGTWVFFRK
ncbi:MAG: N-acetylmuramoyl-L-alanine amidase [Kiritimatiellia bacterium]